MIHKQRVVSCSIIYNLFHSPFGVHADKSYSELVIWDSLLFSLHMLCKQNTAVNWPEMVWHSPHYICNRSRVIEIVELNVPDRSKHENSENWIVQMKDLRTILVLEAHLKTLTLNPHLTELLNPLPCHSACKQWRCKAL